MVVIEQIEIAWSAGAEFSFHAADAAQVPGGRDQLVEEGLLDYTLRSYVGLEIGEHRVEFFAIFRANNDVFCREPMRTSVSGRAGFAFGRFRAGAETGIGSVGGLGGDGLGHDLCSLRF